MACTGQSWGTVCVRRAPPRGVQGAASYRGGAEGHCSPRPGKKEVKEDVASRRRGGQLENIFPDCFPFLKASKVFCLGS